MFTFFSVNPLPKHAQAVFFHGLGYGLFHVCTRFRTSLFVSTTEQCLGTLSEWTIGTLYNSQMTWEYWNGKQTKKNFAHVICQVPFFETQKHGRHVIFFRYQQVPYLLFLAIGLREVRPLKHSWHAISRSFLNIAKTDNKHGCQFLGNGKRSSTSYDTAHSYKNHMYIITSMAGAPRIHAHTHKAVMKIKEQVGTLMKLNHNMKNSVRPNLIWWKRLGIWWKLMTT